MPLIEELIEGLKSGDTLIMDNLSSHKFKEVKELFEEKGINILYFQPYNPEYKVEDKKYCNKYLSSNKSLYLFGVGFSVKLINIKLFY